MLLIITSIFIGIITFFVYKIQKSKLQLLQKLHSDKYYFLEEELQKLSKYHTYIAIIITAFIWLILLLLGLA